MTHVFEQTILAARRRYRMMMLFAMLALLLSALGVGGFFLYARGVAIEVKPEEATSLAVLSVSDGFAFAFGHSLYAVAGDVSFTVTAPGFREHTRRLPADLFGKTLSVELRPLPGRLTATTIPEGEQTRWRVDAVPVAIDPVLKTELEAGTYTLDVDNPFFRPATTRIVMKRGEETRLSIPLTPVTGELRINSVPEGATVLIDNVPAGTTPLATTRTGGRYALALQLDGYQTSQETIDITNTEQKIERNYRLQPLSASLTVSARPAGGILLVNGRKTSPGQSLFLAINQDHVVSYTVPGYAPFRETVRLAKGEERDITIRLKVASGKVSLSSSPPADIFIDATPMGRTPATLDLPSRPARLVLRREGYRTVTKTITPRVDETITVRTTLQTESEAALAEAKPLYRNTLGMTFRLFRPGSYTMGAPRHQKGQRANEFLRKVRLTRHFYAGAHEVTNSQFRAFSSGHRPDASPDHPVVHVSWENAARFCNWLSKKEGLAPFYNFSGGTYTGFNPQKTGYRLLSEAEWEYLTRRAGRKETVVFPWGDTRTIPRGAGNIADENAKGTATSIIPDYNDGFASTAPVGSFPAEPSGLYDLTGNVSEWVHDFYTLEPPGKDQTYVDPLGSRRGGLHVFKGAGFLSGNRTTLRASYRDGFRGTRHDIGFRIGRYVYGTKETTRDAENNAKN